MTHPSISILKITVLLLFCFIFNLFCCSSLIRHDLVFTLPFILFVVVLRTWDMFHCALYFFLLSMFSLFTIRYHINLPSPIHLFIPLIVSTILILPLQPARATLSWLKRGCIDRTSWIFTGITGIGSVAALIIWAFSTDNLGMGLKLAQSVSEYPRWLLITLGVPLFAAINAFVEEAIVRGVVQEAAMRVIRQPIVVIGAQSAVFAAMHYVGGFPNGIAGYVMVFVYGCLLGILRIRSKGLLAPWIAHCIADLTIGYFLLWYVFR